MKKFILFAAILFAGVSVANAEGPTTTDNAKLSVVLSPIQTIIIGEKTVNLNYLSIEDYRVGVTETKTDHLLIHSSGKFAVTVKSENENLTNGTESIDLNTIQIGVVGEGAIGAKPLTKAGETLISQDNGGANLKFTVAYKGKGDYAYMDKFSSADGAINTYTTNVIYTISPN